MALENEKISVLRMGTAAEENLMKKFWHLALAD
jgi:hypothetical protein